MTTTASRPAPTDFPPGRDRLVLYDVSWDEYEKMLSAFRERAERLTYDGGTLEIMPPRPEHERPSRFLHDLITALAEELLQEADAYGSTTFRREDLKRGIEPDECYYIANASRVQGLAEIDLAKDPPPDLAVEVDVTHSSVDKQSIYAAIRVPELWRLDHGQIEILLLEPDGQYRRSDRSGCFPSLPASILQEFLDRWSVAGHMATLREFREWIRTNRAKKTT